MKQILYVLGLAILLSTTFTSCKENSLDALRDYELETLDKYVKDNNLAEYKDDSGIYFKILEPNPDTTALLIKKDFKVMLTLSTLQLDSTQVFTLSTVDKNGQTFEEFPFYVDLSNDSPVQQIAGLHIGLKKMHIGDRAMILIPSELAFKAIDYSSTIGIPRFTSLLMYVYAKKGYAPVEN